MCKYVDQMAWLPCWPPRGLQSLALKAREDFTRRSKQRYQWPHKKDLSLPKFFLKNVFGDICYSYQIYDILVTKLPPFRNSNHITMDLDKIQDWMMAYLHCRTWHSHPNQGMDISLKMGTVVIGNQCPNRDLIPCNVNIFCTVQCYLQVFNLDPIRYLSRCPTM